MSSITIRNLEDGLKRKLRLRAALRNHSMEEEARDILRCALSEELIEPLGGVDLPPFPRGPIREPPDFT